MATSPAPSESTPSGTADRTGITATERKEPKGWRAKLPKIPDPIDVDLPVSGRSAFFGWLGLSLVLIALGVYLNWSLTDGQWVLPEQGFDDFRNPFGETEVQFLTSHPYDVLTASLFVASTVLLGLSILPRRAFSDVAPYGWWRAYDLLVRRRHGIRAIGWILFAFHWAATALNFFFVEDGDWVNMAFAFASVFVLTYFAYQELVSKRLGQDNPSLHFAAGAVFLAATVWYAFLRVPVLSEWIIETVAGHTVWLLHVLGQNVEIGPDGRTGFVSAITYPNQPDIQRTVIIILACTAIQSMMIFVAAALAVQKADWHRRAMVIGVTVPLVYVLNLVRNVSIIFLWETRWLEQNLGVSPDQAFNVAHNWIGKVGSLLALVVIALFVFRVLPEVVQAVVGLLDLPRRRGPLEQYYQSLPAGSPMRTMGVLTALAGIAWAGLQNPIDGGIVVLVGLTFYYLGMQKARRARDAASETKQKPELEA